MTTVRPGFFGPRDNFPLSANDWARIDATVDTVIALRDGRQAYLAAHGLDARLHLPAHMWNQDFVASHFTELAKKDRHTISHLRCFTHNFTGFSLLAMAPCQHAPDVRSVPADADARIRAVAGRAREATVEFVRCSQGMPRDRIAQTPRLFGESGWDVDGTIANFDTWSTQQRLNALHWSGVLDFLQQRGRERGFARVLEIGAGFGNLGYALRCAVGPIDYTVVDLPESIIYSSIWLPTALGGERATIARPGQQLAAPSPGATFVANHMIGEFQPQLGEFDLVINTMSLSEMSAAQIEHYGRMARELIGQRGLFYEQNYVVAGVQTDLVPILAKVFAYGALLDETPNPHRGRGEVRMWANAYRDELWNRGGVTPIATNALAPAVTIPAATPGRLLAPIA
jgi:putative sugar O-methyltransferase